MVAEGVQLWLAFEGWQASVPADPADDVFHMPSTLHAEATYALLETTMFKGG